MVAKTVVLIPCFNEAPTVEKVIGDFRAALPHAEIVVCDNNSTDGTGAIARQCGAKVLHEARQGKGNAVRRMFRALDAACYIVVDGDDTYPAASAAEMERLVLAHHADMVVGDRLSASYFTQNKRRFHGFGNRLVRWLTGRIFGRQVRDIMTGYRAFSYEYVKTFPVLSRGFEIETEMTFHALDKNMGIENVVVDYRDRPQGSVSKLNTVSDGLRVLRTVAKLFKNYRSFAFFGLFALLLLLVALVLFVPVFVEYIMTGLVERFPTLIVSGFLFVAAVLSFFTGLILDTIAHHQRQAFEIALHQAVFNKKRLFGEGEGAANENS